MSEFVEPADLRVSRDGDGQVLPETEETDLFGKVLVIPMTYGDTRKYLGDNESFTLETEMLAELFDEFIRKPDLSADAGGTVTVEYVEEMYPLAPRELLMAILRASGVDAEVEMDEENTEAKVEVAGN